MKINIKCEHIFDSSLFIFLNIFTSTKLKIKKKKQTYQVITFI